MLTTNRVLIAALVFYANLPFVNGQTTIASAIVFKAANFTGGEQLQQMGTITFTQQASSNTVQVRGQLTGLTSGEHGFHVHDKGDLGNMCNNAAGHFNPENQNHGAPTDSVRHVGDLGNVIATAGVTLNVVIDDTLIQLNGRHSIMGRAIVIHELRDDLGKGGTNVSLTTGNAGARIGCGVISIASDNYLPIGSTSHHASASILIPLASLAAVIAHQLG